MIKYVFELKANFESINSKNLTWYEEKAGLVPHHWKYSLQISLSSAYKKYKIITSVRSQRHCMPKTFWHIIVRFIINKEVLIIMQKCLQKSLYL